jgi:Right handed beta helix region/Protein of unknown function (DUF1565)
VRHGTAEGELALKASLVADGGVSATGSRYRIPFVTSAPALRTWVSPSGDDSAAGTEVAPLKTIQAAVDAATAGTAIMIKAGTYTENVKLTKSQLWLISADGPGAVKLVPANVSDSTLQGYALHDIVLQGLDVTAPAPTTGDSDAIKFAASGDVSVEANQNTNLAIVDCTVRTPSSGGYNGVKISTADGVYLIHNVLDGAGLEGNGDAVDLVGCTNSEVAWNFATNVPAHGAIQLKGGSTTVSVHDNLFSKLGADGLWIGGGTVEAFMHPSTAYEACNVTAHNNVMLDLGGSAIHFVGGKNSKVTHLFSARTGNTHLQHERSPVHTPPISSTGNSVLFSVFDATHGALYEEPGNLGTLTVDVANDLPLSMVSSAAGHQSFDGGALITAGGGNDVTHLTRAQGSTVIEHFQPATDVVSLTDFGFTSFDAVLAHAHQLGPAVWIELPNDFVLVLTDVQLTQLTSTNFQR